MDNRKWESGASATPPTVPAAPSSGYPTDGDPIASVPPTIPGAFHFYQLGEEMRAVIEGQGFTPSTSDLTQLRQAITKMIQGAQRAVIIDTVTFNAGVANGNAVYWDSANSRFDKALADGSAAQNCVGFADVTNSKVYAFGDAVLFSGLTPGSVYYLSGATAGAITVTAPTNAKTVGIAKSATEVFVDIDSVGGITQVLRGALLANLSVSGATLTVNGPGYSADSTATVLMSWAAAIAKTTGAWAVGTGNGGLDTGAIANSTWYYAYIIQRADTGVVDMIFSLSSAAPTMPANYTYYRYIGAIKTDGAAQWVPFFQIGNDFLWVTVPALDFNGAGSTTARLLTLTVPLGRRVLARLNVYCAQDATSYFSSPDCADMAPSSTAAPLISAYVGGTVNVSSAAQVKCWANTSGQVRHRAQGVQVYKVCTTGWTDLRDTLG